MNIQDIITEFGAYYLNQGQNLTRIHQKLRRQLVTPKMFTPVYTDDTIWRASEARHSRIVQPFQKAFTPTGTTTFVPVEIRQFQMKADLSETPDDLEASWFGFMADENVKRSEWPFIRWWIETLIIPQIAQDIELNEIGRGVYAAPTANTPGAAGTSMDGLQKIIADHITSGRITPITLGAIPVDDQDYVESLEQFHAGIEQAYRNIPMTIYMSEDLVLKFKRGYNKKYGKDTNTEDNASGVTKVKFTNLTLAGIPSMNLKANGTACSRIFATPKENAILLQKKTNNMTKFDIQPFDRQVKLLTDWWMGAGFIIPEIVFTNDQT